MRCNGILIEDTIGDKLSQKTSALIENISIFCRIFPINVRLNNQNNFSNTLSVLPANKHEFLF